MSSAKYRSSVGNQSAFSLATAAYPWKIKKNFSTRRFSKQQRKPPAYQIAQEINRQQTSANPLKTTTNLSLTSAIKVMTGLVVVPSL